MDEVTKANRRDKDESRVMPPETEYIREGKKCWIMLVKFMEDLKT